MSLNELAQHVSLDVTKKTMTSEQLQNKYGMVSLPVIQNLTQGRFLSILAIETSRELTPEEYFTLVGGVKTQLADLEPSAQLLAGNEIPVFENRHINLYVTAHMRVEAPRITTEPNIET